MIKVIKVAVVEDSKEDLDNCLSILDRYAKDKDLTFEIDTFETGDAFLTHFKAQYDFIILDINLSATNGIDVANTLREKDDEVVIMFVTNLARYATRGYEVGAIDFAIKPLVYAQFYLKMERVMKRIETRDKNEASIVLTTANGFRKINMNDIFYLEIFGHDIVFHLEDSEFTTYGTLKTYESQLKPYWFIRCNSCYLVNARKIKLVDKYDIYLTNDEKVIISHPKKKEFTKQFKEYIMKGGN